jgi:SAM-dependent methyltransferase
MSTPALSFNAWLRFDIVRRIMSDLDGTTFLEIGCGGGALGSWLSTRYEYVGYEPDYMSYAAAQRAIGNNGRVINEYLPSTPVNEFDLVGAFEVLEHIEDDRAALGQWFYWVRPGGHLLLSVPASEAQYGAADVKAGHFRRYEKRDLKRILRESGFGDPVVFTYGFPLGYVLQAARNLIASQQPATQDAAMQERTLASGRWLQPPHAWRTLPCFLTWPFRVMQRPFITTTLGTGYVVSARRLD